MYSRTVRLPGGGVAHCCGDKSILPKPLPDCEFCRRKNQGHNLCDYLTGGKCRRCSGHGERRMTATEARLHQGFVNILSGQWEHTEEEKERAALHLEAFTAAIKCYWCSGSGKQNCNRSFCGERCGVRISEQEGYCPDHQERAGHKKQLMRERCQWVESALAVSRCLRRDCNKVVQRGDRVLYFPDRVRWMDQACGEEYLRVSVEK